MISEGSIDSIEFYLNLLKDLRTKPEDEKEAKSGLIRRVPQLISTIRELQKRLADEWYCPECDEYTDDVTFEENHGVCGNPVKVVNTFIQDLQAENERLMELLNPIRETCKLKGPCQVCGGTGDFEVEKDSEGQTIGMTQTSCPNCQPTERKEEGK